MKDTRITAEELEAALSGELKDLFAEVTVAMNTAEPGWGKSLTGDGPSDMLESSRDRGGTREVRSIGAGCRQADAAVGVSLRACQEEKEE